MFVERDSFPRDEREIWRVSCGAELEWKRHKWAEHWRYMSIQCRVPCFAQRMRNLPHFALITVSLCVPQVRMTVAITMHWSGIAGIFHVGLVKSSHHVPLHHTQPASCDSLVEKLKLTTNYGQSANLELWSSGEPLQLRHHHHLVVAVDHIEKSYNI